MIESYYWKEDLLNYAKQFQPVSKPPRWSERLQVNFEKDVIIAFFMIRKLIEATKLSSKTNSYISQVFRSPCVGRVNNSNFSSIDKLYDFEAEKRVGKKVNFLCNQLIHGGAIFAYREEDRNWGGIYTYSDFEREKYIYRIPLSKIIHILEIAGSDYPNTISMKYCENKQDYIVETD